MQTPEGKVKDEVKAYLKSIGACWFMPVQMGYGGTALDFITCIEGRYVEIETKASGNTPTPRQRLRMKAVEDAGGVAVWGDNIVDIKLAVGVALKMVQA